MNHGQIPQDIRQFLEKYIRSVGHLELMLFMFDRRECSWSTSELTGEMRTNDNLVADQVRDLMGIIQVSSEDVAKFRFVINDENLEIARRISDLYRTRRHAVIDAIYNRQLSTIVLPMPLRLEKIANERNCLCGMCFNKLGLCGNAVKSPSYTSSAYTFLERCLLRRSFHK